MNHATLRRHRFGLVDVDESLLRAMRLSYRRHAFRLSAARRKQGGQDHSDRNLSERPARLPSPS